jgi:glucokinase
MDDPAQLDAFLLGEVRSIEVPGSRRRLLYDPMRRTAVGISRLGTREAVAAGAYAFALRELDKR